MTFGRWYPLAEASAPARPGILQLKIPAGLIAYPRGRSAMILYRAADDLAAAVAELARQHRDRDWLCRHTEELSSSESADLVAACDRLVERFRVRFGAEPRLPE